MERIERTLVIINGEEEFEVELPLSLSSILAEFEATTLAIECAAAERRARAESRRRAAAVPTLPFSLAFSSAF